MGIFGKQKAPLGKSGKSGNAPPRSELFPKV